MGFETLMSDLISERKGLDRFAERQRRGLKINPLGASKGEVLRSVRPQTRPENFAQGGPVMRGIGTLNETARNMFRGPRGIGAYQQFADGGPVYMKEGGEVITPDDIAGMREKIMNDYGFDPEDVAVQEGVSPELFLRLLFKENRGRLKKNILFTNLSYFN